MDAKQKNKDKNNTKTKEDATPIGNDETGKGKGGDSGVFLKGDRKPDSATGPGSKAGQSGSASDISASSVFPYCPNNPVVSVCFHHKQFLSVANADEDTIERVESAMKFNYCKGVKRGLFNSQEGVRRIELYGMPFQPYFMDHMTFVHAVFMMLKDLLKAGLTVVSVANIGFGRDMFVWFLRKENFNTRRQHQFGMVELHGRCKLRTYGNSQQFLPHFEEIIKEKGHEIAEKEKEFSLFETLRTKKPIWETKRSADTLQSKSILTSVLRKLESEGMNIYMSVPLDRKRSSIMCWKKKSPVSDEAEPQAENVASPGFMLTLMRKNRIVLSEAETPVSQLVHKCIKDSWKRRVSVEKAGLLEDEEEKGDKTFILKGQPFSQSSLENTRNLLEVMLALFANLRSIGFVACTNLHMIVNVLDKGCIWFSSAPKKDVEFCAIMVENDNSLRAYKVPSECIDNINANILDCVLPESSDWTVKEGEGTAEYLWKFEERLWVSHSCKDWTVEDTMLEKGHAVLCAVLHSMIEENYHPVIALNLPPSGTAEPNETKDKGSNPVRAICTFFFAKDEPHYNSKIYPEKDPNDDLSAFTSNINTSLLS